MNDLTRSSSKLLFLSGPPGVGKTTLGKALAEALSLPHIDLDRRVEESMRQPVDAWILSYGWDAFRAKERVELRACIESLQADVRCNRAVISLGGGTMVDPENRRLVLRSGLVAGLEDEPDRIFERLSKREPAWVGFRGEQSEAVRRALFHDLLREREAAYGEVHLRFPVSVESTEGILDRAKQLARLASTSVLAFVAHGTFSHGAFFRESGHRAEASQDIPFGHLAERLRWMGSRSIGLVIDRCLRTMVDRALDAAGVRVPIYEFDAGEDAKELGSLPALLRWCSEQGLHRGSTLVAVGGGSTLDTVGFLASIYMRGISWIAVPTTTLSIFDSGMGGKTGINVENRKNQAGTFHAPSWTWIDLDSVQSLPTPSYLDGYAEALKCAFLEGPDALDEFESWIPGILARDEEALRRVASRALQLKARWVGEDPWDHGSRRFLNFGHTVGHALEAASEYRVTHGAAVVAGMIAMLCFSGSETTAHCARLVKIAKALGFQAVSAKLLRRCTAHLLSDKKRASSIESKAPQLRIVVCAEPGSPKIEMVEIELFAKWLEANAEQLSRWD